jgi:glycosyltransferase involved in cell wall biosynthesis
LIIQEAAAAGRPVIGSDIGGVAEKVLEQPGGVSFRVGDGMELADRIEEMASLPAEARSPAPRGEAPGGTAALLALYAGTAVRLASVG